MKLPHFMREQLEHAEQLTTLQRSHLTFDDQIALQLKLLNAKGLDPANYEPRLIRGVACLVKKLHPNPKSR